ncbi:MAG: 23S rRNA (pseudouridine(1915)-N(3))-methyltransferase RlmH [Burkholderiales bacterium]
MQKLLVLAVAARLPAWAETACAQYAARMPRGFELERAAVRPEPRTQGKPMPKLLAAEAARVSERLPRGAVVVAMDERGIDVDTRGFAARMRAWLDAPEPVAFVIGGPDGMDEALKRRAAARIRLSSLTLPHALAQVLLCEQLYRAATLLSGHPYHRD